MEDFKEAKPIPQTTKASKSGKFQFGHLFDNNDELKDKNGKKARNILNIVKEESDEKTPIKIRASRIKNKAKVK